MPQDKNSFNAQSGNTIRNELHKSEEKYRLLVEGIRDYAIFMLDPEGNVESWNEGAERLKGYSEEEIIGKHFSIFYPQSVKDSGYPEYELRQAKLIGRYEDEGWRVRKDGSLFFANVVITAMKDIKGDLIGYSKITRDLTERKIAEEQLRKGEEKYRSLVEGVKDYAIFMLDPNGIIISWNEGARRLKKYEEHEILGKHISIFYPEEKKAEKYPEFELSEAAKNGKFEDEGIRVRKDGSTFYANVIITAIYNEKQEILGFSKITRDLTERKLAEDKLTKINEELEKRVGERTMELTRSVEELKKINIDLDNFIYTASHDLKAPVSNIEGLMTALSKVLQKHNLNDELIYKLLDMINHSVKRFQTTIKDLAAINESQKTEKEDAVDVSLADIIEDVLLSIDHLVKDSKASITIDTNYASTFRFSKVQIRSVIYNLIINAIKYRSPSRPLEIAVRNSQDDEYNIVEIKDNGLGISEENKEKIFQMFKRVHSHVEGSGIGLYIVKRIVENVGGKIEVESEVDAGSTFKVYIPR